MDTSQPTATSAAFLSNVPTPYIEGSIVSVEVAFSENVPHTDGPGGAKASVTLCAGSTNREAKYVSRAQTSSFFNTK